MTPDYNDLYWIAAFRAREVDLILRAATREKPDYNFISVFVTPDLDMGSAYWDKELRKYTSITTSQFKTINL